MATTLEDLEKRVAALEQAVAEMRPREPAPPANETREEKVRRILREVCVDPVAHRARWEKVFAEMGITDEPVGPEKLREMFLAEGHDPNDNSFSRGIIEMREE